MEDSGRAVSETSSGSELFGIGPLSLAIQSYAFTGLDFACYVLANDLSGGLILYASYTTATGGKDGLVISESVEKCLT